MYKNITYTVITSKAKICTSPSCRHDFKIKKLLYISPALYYKEHYNCNIWGCQGLCMAHVSHMPSWDLDPINQLNCKLCTPKLHFP